MFLVYFFLLLTVLVQARAEEVLIFCRPSCGCVSENGVALHCPFIKQDESAVLRASRIYTHFNLRSRYFRAHRFVRIGTAFVSSGSGCPFGKPSFSQNMSRICREVAARPRTSNVKSDLVVKQDNVQVALINNAPDKDAEVEIKPILSGGATANGVLYDCLAK